MNHLHDTTVLVLGLGDSGPRDGALVRARSAPTCASGIRASSPPTPRRSPSTCLLRNGCVGR